MCKEWYKNHPKKPEEDKVFLEVLESFKKTREWARERHAKWYAQNREKQIEYNKRWRTKKQLVY